MPNGKKWEDKQGVYLVPNENGRDYGKMSIRESMERSLNPVFTQLAADVGFDKVQKAAVDAGLPGDTPGSTS